MIALHLTVHGRVQGVCYRNWTVQTARQLGLAGWVRNQPDGAVEAVVQGDDALVRQMIELMGASPPAAIVERIEQRPCKFENISEFQRK